MHVVPGRALHQASDFCSLAGQADHLLRNSLSFHLTEAEFSEKTREVTS